MTSSGVIIRKEEWLAPLLQIRTLTRCTIRCCIGYGVVFAFQKNWKDLKKSQIPKFIGVGLRAWSVFIIYGESGNQSNSSWLFCGRYSKSKETGNRQPVLTDFHVWRCNPFGDAYRVVWYFVWCWLFSLFARRIASKICFGSNSFIKTRSNSFSLGFGQYAGWPQIQSWTYGQNFR